MAAVGDSYGVANLSVGARRNARRGNGEGVRSGDGDTVALQLRRRRWEAGSIREI